MRTREHEHDMNMNISCSPTVASPTLREGNSKIIRRLRARRLQELLAALLGRVVEVDQPSVPQPLQPSLHTLVQKSIAVVSKVEGLELGEALERLGHLVVPAAFSQQQAAAAASSRLFT